MRDTGEFSFVLGWTGLIIVGLSFSCIAVLCLDFREFISFLDEVKPPAETKTDTMVTSSTLGIEYLSTNIVLESFYFPFAQILNI